MPTTAPEPFTPQEEARITQNLRATYVPLLCPRCARPLSSSTSTVDGRRVWHYVCMACNRRITLK